MKKVFLFLFKYLLRGRKTWFLSSGFFLFLKVVKSFTGRRGVVDASSTKPGEKLVIEHLTTTHGAQMKEEKKAKKASRKARKAAKKG